MLTCVLTFVLDMCADMCADRCTDLCADLCADMCDDMCADLCAGMSADMCARFRLVIAFFCPEIETRRRVAMPDGGGTYGRMHARAHTCTADLGWKTMQLLSWPAMLAVQACATILACTCIDTSVDMCMDPSFVAGVQTCVLTCV